MPKANAPNAPWVLVWLSPADPWSGQREPHLGADHVDDSLLLAGERVQLDAELGAVLLQRRELGGALAVLHQQARARAGAAWSAWNDHGGDREVGPTHAQPAARAAREGLRRG